VPVVDTGPNGEAVVIFNQIESVTGRITGVVRLIRVGADNLITADQTVAGVDQIPWGPGEQFLDVAPDGTANIVGLTFSGDPVHPIVTSVQLVRIPRTGSEQAVQLDQDTTTATSAVRVLSSSETVAAWEPVDQATATVGTVRIRHVSAAGVAGPVLPASPAGFRADALSIGGNGSVLAATNPGSGGR